jgi:signal transduction histidine kinase
MRVPDAMPASALRLFNSVVVEAVGNAVHHGGADAVDVRAELRPGALTITVDDDGSGVAPQIRDGLGLAAIRAIASECSLRPRPAGGTRFEARLPYLV